MTHIDLKRAHIDLKRVTDIVVSAALLLVTLPVIVLAAIASAVTLRAWPFFVQERVGRHGTPFRFVKIRTLPRTFAQYAPKGELVHAEVPPLMRRLRASHLDELPQLLLVLTGRMSLVGPRPEMAMLHDRLAPEVAAERVSVRPGITGLWQVSTHCEGLICDRVEYDRLYVRYSNPLLDLWIMARTAQKMVRGQRIHLFEIPRWAIGPERTVGTSALAVTEAAPVTIDLTDEALADATLVDRTPVAAVD